MYHFLLPCLSLILSMGQGQSYVKRQTWQPLSTRAVENPYKTVGAIPLPDGYHRVPAAIGSFGYWLRDLPLKKNKTVFLFNGHPKVNQEAQFAVLNIPVGDKDLQQCADAVMRLRAEYLFSQGKYSSILFRDNNNKAYLFQPPYTAANFNRYLERVFAWCGTNSLSKQLRKTASINAITPGDVLIKGGFPGHAVMVLDVAENNEGRKIFLLAQSYMPAQDIHILRNPLQAEAPWYETGNASKLVTPEWVFELPGALKTW